MKCTIHIDDEVRCRLGGLRPEHVDYFFDKFGVFVEGFMHMPMYQLRRWDGKVRFFDKNARTYTKILDEIVPHLCSWGYEVDISDKRNPTKAIEDRVGDDIFAKDDFKLRPYQVEVVNTLLEAGSGFAICATGAGKCLSGDTLINIDVPIELARIIDELQRAQEDTS